MNSTPEGQPAGSRLPYSSAMLAAMRPRSAHVNPTVVLVHGAFADAMSWRLVIRLLQETGHSVVALRNPLSALDDDIKYTQRAIAALPGPVVLVAHGYGGAVISAAAAGLSNVRALVYIAALAPTAGEVIGELMQAFGPSPLLHAMRPDTSGRLTLDRRGFRAVFAHDVDPAEARVMAAAQAPLAEVALTEGISQAAWTRLPSWYLVALEDNALHPELQRYMAQRMDAVTREVKASHVPQLSQPGVVAALIDEAVCEAMLDAALTDAPSP